MSNENVFEQVGFDPAEAEKLRLQSQLAIEIEQYIKSEGLTQKEAAERFGITQPRVSDLLRGKLDLVTIDALVGMLARVNRTIRMDVLLAA